MPDTSNTSVWFSPAEPERLNDLQKESLVNTLGIEITEIGDDFIRGTMPVTPAHHQPMGILHGGASVSLAETLGSLGAGLTLDLSKSYPVGLEINANHVRSTSSGVVTGTARPLHLGRTTQIWEIHIRDQDDRLTCISRLTVAILEHR